MGLAQWQLVELIGLAVDDTVRELAGKMADILAHSPLRIVCVGNPQYAFDAFGPLVARKIEAARGAAAASEWMDPFGWARVETIYVSRNTLADAGRHARALSDRSGTVLLVDACLCLPRQLGRMFYVSPEDLPSRGWRRRVLEVALWTGERIGGIKSAWGADGGCDAADGFLCFGAYTMFGRRVGWGHADAAAKVATAALMEAVRRQRAVKVSALPGSVTAEERARVELLLAETTEEGPT